MHAYALYSALAHLESYGTWFLSRFALAIAPIFFLPFSILICICFLIGLFSGLFHIRTQSPRKTVATTPVNGASPNKMRKMDADNGKKTTIAKPSTEFVAIKTEATMAFDPSLEPLLRDNPNRFVIFPIQYKDIWAMYKKVNINIVHTFLVAVKWNRCL